MQTNYTQKGVSTLMLVGVMAVVLMAFGVVLFATKPPTNVNSNAAANITNVQLPTIKPHTSMAPQSNAGASATLTPTTSEDLDAAANDLNSENLDETSSDAADINTQATEF